MWYFSQYDPITLYRDSEVKLVKLKLLLLQQLLLLVLLKRTFGDSWNEPIPARCLARHGTNSVKVKKKTKNVDNGTLILQYWHIPPSISTKSEPAMARNGTCASVATAFASRVFPQPGGPSSSAPFGILAPSCCNRLTAPQWMMK